MGPSNWMQNAFKDASLEPLAICLIRERIPSTMEAAAQSSGMGWRWVSG